MAAEADIKGSEEVFHRSSNFHRSDLFGETARSAICRTDVGGQLVCYCFAAVCMYVVFRILKQDKFVPNGNYLTILHHGFRQIKFLEPQNRVCAGPRSVLQLRLQQSTRI